MIPGEDCSDDDEYYGVNPYESFMKRHLQHYGYYTGKNQNYKNQFQQYAEWEKNYAYNLSSSGSDSDSDSDDDDKNDDRKLQEDLLKTTQLIYSCGESGKMVPRLREPRSLYALNKELGPQQAARWPSDLQVINERIRHLQHGPAETEPFYKLTGFEKCPMVRGEANGGRVVFSYETKSSFFMKSRVGGSRSGCDQCAVPLQSDEDTTLIFESRFESGNLGKVVQVGDYEYELWLRYDLYTNKHTQWFYFRVSNTRTDKQYRFTIVNLMKPDSLYNNGMRPVVYSETDAALNKVGWVRGCKDIKYYKNNLRYEQSRYDRNYYSLTFTSDFKYNHDTVYFAHCYPYTYTDLQDYLLELTNDPIKARICKQRVLCRTLAGNLVYVLTITSASQSPGDMKHKKAVVVTSRVHPGESNASWMMKGFLDFVTGNSPDAKLLRDTFIFKVVPMLNPDGVIVGNYRCSLAGRDLNRNYKTSLKDAYPSVWHTKTMIRKLLQERDIIVYCDLHGHSRKQNVFIYGCEQQHNSNKRFHERIFPSMLNKNSPDKFCFNACRFKVQKSKEGTGRVVMWNMGIMNSYTLEATFCGSSMGKKKGSHFSQSDFEMMGYHFCDTLLDYCDPDNTKYAKILVDLEDRHKMEVISKIAQQGLQAENVDLSDISTDMESSDGGSDSSVSDGPPVHLQYAAARPKKKRLRTKKDRDLVRPGKEKVPPPQPEEKRVRNNQIRPLKVDPSKIQAQPMRYTSSSPRRPHSHDERSNSGIPVFVQERFEEKQQKRNDYLEALTAAYISNSIPIVTEPGQEGEAPPDVDGRTGQVAHTHGVSPGAVAMARAWSANSQGSESVPARTDPGQLREAINDLELRRLTPKWLQEAAVRMYPLSEVNRAEDHNMEDLLRTHLQHPASINPLDRKVKPHLLEVSAAQQRQTEALNRDKNGPIKTHPSPFEEKGESSKRGEHGMKTQVPSATYVNYNTFRVSQMPEGNERGDEEVPEQDVKRRGGHHRDKDRSGRKSRKGMREGEDEEDLDYPSHQTNPDLFEAKDEHASHPPRVRSARTSSNMATALSSIHTIQRNLQPPGDAQAGDGAQNEGTKDYIQKLIRETNEEIKDLTNEIQEDIEKKHHRSKDLAKVAQGQAASSPNQLETVPRSVADSKGGGQRTSLGMSYHGSTFIKDLGIKRHLSPMEERLHAGHLGKPAAGALSQAIINKAALAGPRPNEYISYTSHSDTAWTASGPNLMVSNKRGVETPIEEEARARSIMRQSGLNPNPGTINSGRTSNQSQHQHHLQRQDFSEHAAMLGNTPAATPTMITMNGHKDALTTPEDLGMGYNYFRQLSSSSYNNGINHSASGARLNKTNLVFRTVGQPASEVAQETGGDNADGRGTELGDTGEHTRARSARSSSRQVVETVPTKISLMICSDHQEPPAPTPGTYLPPSRQSRQHFHRPQGRKK